LLNLKEIFLHILIYPGGIFLKIKKKLKAGLPGQFSKVHVMKTKFVWPYSKNLKK